MVMHNAITEPMPGEDSIDNFPFHIPDNFMSKPPVAQGSFGKIYRCTIKSSVPGEVEVAVKVFKVDSRRSTEELTRVVHRELKVCCGLKHPNIVPLLGIAQVESPFPALVSRWMISGTLFEYLKKQATTISPPARGDLVEGIAEGLDYRRSFSFSILHHYFILCDRQFMRTILSTEIYIPYELSSELFVDYVTFIRILQGNVLIDDSGNPCIADFGFATIAEDPEWRWSSTTLGRDFNSRWGAPEVLGINGDPHSPTFKSDIYSFGSVTFFIVSGDVPWKEKNHAQINIQLSNRATHSRPQNILDNHWDLIQQCWSWEPKSRPKTAALARRACTYFPHTPLFVPHGGGVSKNIVIFGETGAGKSSVINLMAGKQVAKVSPDSHRCTLQWKEYRITIGDTPYQVFDTVGLEDPTLETKDYLSAITNAYELINRLKESGGINLLLFCIRGGRVTATMKRNYRLFFEFLCDEKVPLALVITNLERENNMEDWYERQVGALEKYGIRSIGHACITAATTIDGRNKVKYEESKNLVSSLIQTHCNALAEGWTGGQGSLASRFIDLVTGRPKKTDVLEVLTRRCGMSKTAAQQIVQALSDS